MSDALQSLLDIVGDPAREDLLSIRAPLQARIQEIEPEERKRLCDECFAVVKSTSREDSNRYYSHYIVFQHLSKATRQPKPLTKEQEEVWEFIRKQREENNGRWYESQVTFIPEEVIARHPIEAMLDPPSA
jgi:hypothetical protein